jgi:hypothetical protein
MSGRRADGSAGDADYAEIAQAYSIYRRPDPRIGRSFHLLWARRTLCSTSARAWGPMSRLAG